MADQVLQELKAINKRLTGLEQGQARLEQGQQKQGKQLDTLLDGQAHTNTAIEALDNKIDATKTELRKEIKERHRPHKAD